MKVVSLSEAEPAPRKPKAVRRWPKYAALALAFVLVSVVARFGAEITEDEFGPRSRTLTTDDGFVAMVVPEKWRETSVVPGSEVEAGDPDGAEYVAVMVRDLEVGPGLETLMEAGSRSVLKRLGSGELVGDPERLEVDGHPAIRQRLTGSVGEGEAVMLITIVDAGDKLVYVAAWTHPGNFLRAKPVFESIVDRLQIGESVDA